MTAGCLKRTTISLVLPRRIFELNTPTPALCSKLKDASNVSLFLLRSITGVLLFMASLPSYYRVILVVASLHDLIILLRLCKVFSANIKILTIDPQPPL